MPPRKYSDAQESEMARLYMSGLNVAQIANLFGGREPTVLGILRRNNVKLRSNAESHRRYVLDESVFDNLDNENACYWYGFIYADGCVQKKRNALVVTLAEKDRRHLQKLRLFFKSNKPLAHHRQVYGGRQIDNPMLYINSKHLAERLFSLGIVPYREPVYVPDFLPSHLYRHWLRGLFDGDGCATHTQYGRTLLLNLICPPEVADHAVCMLKENAGIESVSVYPNFRRGRSVMAIFARRDCRRAYHYLYDDSTVYLERKRSRMEFFLNQETQGEYWERQRETAKNLFASGMTGYGIATTMGLRASVVYRWIRRYGW